MYMVPVAMLLVLIVALIVVVACYITIVIVAVLFVFSIARRPLFVVPGTVSLLAVRTIAIVLFAIALTALLIGGTVFLIRR